MNSERINNLKVATAGIDGVGKTTSLNFSSNKLFEKGVERISFLGRKPFSVENGEKKYHLPILSVLDYLHETADRTGNKKLVLFTNIAHIITQGRVVEPYMERKVLPDITLSPRDVLVDSAVYAGIYWPELSEKGIPTCISKAKSLSSMEPRKLLFYLTAPTDIAMQRIEKRLDEKSFDRKTHNRPKWAHIHEKDPNLLESLSKRYLPVLNYYRETFGTEVHEVDTFKLNEEEVGNYIADTILERMTNPSTFRRGEWVKTERG